MLDLDEDLIRVFARIGAELAKLTGHEIIIDDDGDIRATWEEYQGCGEYERKERTYSPSELENMYYEQRNKTS